MRLYHHKTSGGAEYLCSSAVDGTTEGSLSSQYIVRIDGDIAKDAELLVRDTPVAPMIAGLQMAAASFEVQAETARQYAKTRDHAANIGLAAEYDRNAAYLRSIIARATARDIRRERQGLSETD